MTVGLSTFVSFGSDFMGILDKAKKYDCPIKFTISKCEAGWTNMTCDFDGTVLKFTISDFGDQPSALIEAAQAFHADEDNYDGLLKIKVEREDNIPDLDGFYWDSVVVRTCFTWEEEPEDARWQISLDPKFYGPENFPLDITIDRWNTDNITQSYRFTVMYRDLCYAVAKCFTEALKTYGFNGYHAGSYTDDTNIRQLLVIKAYALSILSNHVAFEGKPEFKYEFTFEEELRLLGMDM